MVYDKIRRVFLLYGNALRDCPLYARRKEQQMAEKRFQVELPEEVLVCFGWHEAEVPRKVREALVLELLRLDQLSEAQAAALLHLDRWELLEVMGHYRVPAIRMNPAELQRELTQEIRRDGPR
jgi:hypothetical protein